MAKSNRYSKRELQALRAGQMVYRVYLRVDHRTGEIVYHCNDRFAQGKRVLHHFSSIPGTRGSMTFKGRQYKKSDHHYLIDDQFVPRYYTLQEFKLRRWASDDKPIDYIRFVDDCRGQDGIAFKTRRARDKWIEECKAGLYPRAIENCYADDRMDRSLNESLLLMSEDEGDYGTSFQDDYDMSMMNRQKQVDKYQLRNRS